MESVRRDMVGFTDHVGHPRGHVLTGVVGWSETERWPELMEQDPADIDDRIRGNKLEIAPIRIESLGLVKEDVRFGEVSATRPIIGDGDHPGAERGPEDVVRENDRGLAVV